MKKSTMVLSLICASLLLFTIAYAGHGICTEPEESVLVTHEISYYPSGNPAGSFINTTYFHGSSWCEDGEGVCYAEYAPNAVFIMIISDLWIYNDTDDDATRLSYSSSESIQYFGKTICSMLASHMNFYSISIL